MGKNVTYIDLDIDVNQYHGSVLNTETGEVMAFNCRTRLNGLAGQCNRLRKCFPDREFKLCFEASYIGYTLQRTLGDRG